MAAQQFIRHLTVAGERWDLLSWRYYGDPTLYSPIVMANPSVPIEPVFEAGIALVIPVLQGSAAPLPDLPPWKTQAGGA
jgi:phage tail protein X